MTTLTVFVESIVKTNRKYVVTATNGGQGGPPTITWLLDPSFAESCYINKAYRVTIEEVV